MNGIAAAKPKIFPTRLKIAEVETNSLPKFPLLQQEVELSLTLVTDKNASSSNANKNAAGGEKVLTGKEIPLHVRAFFESDYDPVMRQIIPSAWEARPDGIVGLITIRPHTISINADTGSAKING